MNTDFNITIAAQHLKNGEFIRCIIHDTVFLFEDNVVFYKQFNEYNFKELGKIKDFKNKYKDSLFETVIYDEDYAFGFRAE